MFSQDTPSFGCCRSALRVSITSRSWSIPSCGDVTMKLWIFIPIETVEQNHPFAHPSTSNKKGARQPLFTSVVMRIANCYDKVGCVSASVVARNPRINSLRGPKLGCRARRPSRRETVHVLWTESIQSERWKYLYRIREVAPTATVAWSDNDDTGTG